MTVTRDRLRPAACTESGLSASFTLFPAGARRPRAPAFRPCGRTATARPPACSPTRAATAAPGPPPRDRADDASPPPPALARAALGPGRAAGRAGHPGPLLDRRLPA